MRVPWPPGTRMLYVGGDQMTTEMSVPLSRTGPVMPGEEVDVAVEMKAPAELGRYLGYWRLVGPMGRRKFGQRVWVHVQVVDPAGDAMAVDAAAEPSASAATPIDEIDTSTPEGVKLALAAMGFSDGALVDVAVGKHGADLEACARDLAAATEWDNLLDDLAEMGFHNRELNKTLMLKHDGNLKRTVKELVEDA